jgi:hypothetical protein
MKTNGLVLAILVLAAWHCGQAPSQAAVPQLITYQGKLIDLGPPLPPYWATFWIYDAPTNGLPLWGPETHDLGTPTNGLFTVLLGSTNPITDSVFSGTNAYLEIAVQGTVLSPRTRLVTTPYAFQAQNASWAGLAQRVYPNSISTDKLQDLAVNGDKIAWGAVTALQLADGAVTTDKLDNWAVTSVKIASGTTVDMVDYLHASDTPENGKLLALDQAGLFPNKVLHMHHGNELDADMVDGKHATNFLNSTPPITIRGNEETPSWILQAINQTNGFGLIGKSQSGPGVLGESVQGGPGVRGVAMDGLDGGFFGVEGIGRGGVRGYSDSGVGVLAESLTGKALVVNGTAEFNGRIFFQGGLSNQFDGDLITDGTVKGTKFFPGGMMDQTAPLGGQFLWRFQATQPGVAALRTETTVIGTNGVALHSKAGQSGIGPPNQPIGMLGETDQGYAMVAQAAGGVGIKGTSTTGIGVVAQAGGKDALALQALGQSDFRGLIEGPVSRFRNDISGSAARVYGLIGEAPGQPAGNQPVIGIEGRAGTNSLVLGGIQIGVHGETDGGIGLVGTSDSGTAVWARSGSGLALLAESDGGPALRAIGHAIAAALHATNSADGSAGSLATAITANTGGKNNAAAVHARAGVSGLALPNLGGVIGESSSGVGVTGLSDTGVGVMAQAGSGMAVKAESTSGIALQAVAHSSSGTIVASNTASGDAVYGYSAAGVSLHARKDNTNTVALLVEGTSRFTGFARFEGGSGDLAEYYRASEPLEAGEVVVIDRSASLALRKCRQDGDTAAAGIISTSPSQILSGQMQTTEAIPLAIAGRVLCKVDADRGSIEPGDLLTTSTTPGHAMKAEPALQGAIVGKALEPLASGKGKIQVLVMCR